jgi:DNA-binding response OmpR family regulator
MPTVKIVIVEDDKDINELLEYNLQAEGYKTTCVYDGEEALDVIFRIKPDLVVLDIMLPQMNGKEICKVLKSDERTKSIPVIMLTAKSEETDVVVGFELGAEDYVTKPFSPKVLLSRIKAVLKRSESFPQNEGSTRQIGELAIEVSKHKALYKDKVLSLTPIEFNILEFLSRSPGRVFSRDQILDRAWKEGKFIVDRAVDVHIRSLRKKLGKSGAGLIETVHGVGYRFKEPDET